MPNASSGTPEIQSPDIPISLNTAQTIRLLTEAVETITIAGIDRAEAWALPVYFLPDRHEETPDGIPGPALIVITDDFGRPVRVELLSREGLIDERLP